MLSPGGTQVLIEAEYRGFLPPKHPWMSEMLSWGECTSEGGAVVQMMGTEGKVDRGDK